MPSINLYPGSYQLPTTNFPAVSRVGTNNLKEQAAFDAATDETMDFAFIIPAGFSGTPTCRIAWKADTATTGTCIWAVQGISASDAQAHDAAFSTADTVSSTAPAATTDIDISTITMTNASSGWAAGEFGRVRFSRDADAAGDNMAGDAQLLGLSVDY